MKCCCLCGKEINKYNSCVGDIFTGKFLCDSCCKKIKNGAFGTFNDSDTKKDVHSGEGVKLDNGKPRWELMPWKQLGQVTDILTFGAEKYAPNNWKKVTPMSRYVGAAFRHFTSWCEGEKTDKESGKSHLAHAICCLLFLMWADDNGIDIGTDLSSSK